MSFFCVLEYIISMNKYDDFALDFSSFENMAKEYNAQIQSNALKVEKKDVDEKQVNSLLSKIEYLKVLVSDLKRRTSNADILLVLDDISNNIKSQNQILTELFGQGTSIQSQEEDNFKMFCNNLKVAISTTSEIIKTLIEIKDNESVDADTKLKLTEVINCFLDINNSLVSLFGECRYLRF